MSDVAATRRRHVVCLIEVLSFVCISVSVAHAGNRDTPTTAPATVGADAAPLEAELAEIDRRAAAHKDLVAEFVQEKHSPLLRKPLISRGTVRARGGVALWDTVQPERSRMRIEPQWLSVYYPSQQVVEQYPMSGRLGMMVASPLPRLSAIRENFTTEADDGAGLLVEGRAPVRTRALRLVPIDPLMRRAVDQLRVLLDADRGLVLVFEMRDPDGELTVIRFSNLEPDTGLDKSSLELGAPAGTRVVRPLGDVEPNAPWRDSGTAPSR